MRVVAVDDEHLALCNVLELLHMVIPQADIYGFEDPLEALTDIIKNGVDIAFLDIEMFGMNGMELAAAIKKQYATVNVVFTTSYDDYIMEAMGMHASGYIMKPITEGKLRKELGDLRYQIQDARKSSRIRVSTFGNFEVYLDSEPVRFQYAKTKELLAYLVDRNGATASNGEIMGILWGDDVGASGKNSYFKNIRTELVKLFERAEMDDTLIHYRGMIGIQPEKLTCDYYDYIAGKDTAITTYRGEYMSQYSWAEYTNGVLYRTLEG